MYEVRYSSEEGPPFSGCKRVTRDLKHMNEMTIKPSHPLLYLSLKCQDEKWPQARPARSGVPAPPPRSSGLSPGATCCDLCLVLAEGGFLSE